MENMEDSQLPEDLFSLTCVQLRALLKVRGLKNYGLKRELKRYELRVREMILDQLKDQLVQALNRVNGRTPGKAIGLQK